MANIPEGYGLIAGRSRRTAQAALDAAAKAGVDVHEVTAVQEGYVVPLDVLDVYTAAAGGSGASAETEDAAAVPASPGTDAPTAEWKNADIEKWAKKHQVDLGDATKKADMLAAIDAAGSQ